MGVAEAMVANAAAAAVRTKRNESILKVVQSNVPVRVRERNHKRKILRLDVEFVVGIAETMVANVVAAMKMEWKESNFFKGA